MFKPNQKQTIYGDFVRGGVGRYLSEVKPSFTIHEFASWAGIPVTGNLRKRIKSMYYEGVLDCFYALSGSKGSTLVFTLPQQAEPTTKEPF